MSGSPRRVPVWLLVALLLLAGFSIWRGVRGLRENSLSEENAAVGPAEPWKGKFQNEEHWMVDEITRAIGELLAFAKSPATPLEFSVAPVAGKPASYHCTARLGGAAVEETHALEDHFWSPANHAPWAKQLLAAWQLQPAAATADPALLKALTAPTPETLHREAQRLSAALTATPLDAGLHEQTALLIATFAMRDAADSFDDIRRELCRMTAHLAIAQSLQPESRGPIRTAAAAALQTLAARETPALALIAALERDPAEGATAWARALRLRNTGDWRDTPEQLTLIEELEFFFARIRCIDTSAALEWLESRKPAPIDNWRRLVLAWGFGVEEGHQFARESIPREVASLQADWARQFGGKLADADLVKALNEPPGPAVRPGPSGAPAVSVLGWDWWSAQHQRHLCQSIFASIRFFRDKWGVPDFVEVQKAVRKSFAGLTLLPFVERELTTDRREVTAIGQRAQAVIESHPELVPAGLWMHSLEPSSKQLPALAISRPEPWFQPLFPRGTTFDFDGRNHGYHLPPGSDTAWWRTQIDLAPSHYCITWGYQWKQFGERVPPEVAEQGYGVLREYHLQALRQIAKAQKGKSPGYLDTMQRICELEPGRFFDLGDYFLEQKQPERAAEAYQQGVDRDADRVRASNHCEWLVMYLEENGQSKKALKIATEAAEVYSSAGLATMAKLQEKRGQLAAAEDCLKKIAERYDDVSGLSAFYIRQRGNDPAYEAQAAAMEKEMFPRGREKAALADFSGPPEDGAVFTSTNALTTQHGLRAGHVVVAIDGYRVHNLAQYMFVRGLTTDPRLPLIVWKGNGYEELAPTLPDRRFGCDMGDYVKR